MRTVLRFFCLGLAAALLLACSTQSFLSWEESDKTRPHYSVQSGDTLYSIAWDYGMDFRRLATVNQLHPPYPIKPGQILRLPKGYSSPQVASSAPTRRPATTSTPSTRPVQSPKPKPTARKPGWGSSPRTPPVASGSLIAPNRGRWGWPNNGPVVKNWGARKHRRSGLDIAAAPGSTVVASAAGQVVYSGGGLARYGQLVIVKHSETLLSAYAYNQKILVNKGQKVAAGQKLALSGRSPDGVGAVHFEIRKDGKPVDVMQYLRAKNSS